jgi:hypothetical protein
VESYGAEIRVHTEAPGQIIRVQFVADYPPYPDYQTIVRWGKCCLDDISVVLQEHAETPLLKSSHQTHVDPIHETSS